MRRRDGRPVTIYGGAILLSLGCGIALDLYFSRLRDGTSVDGLVGSFAAHETYFRWVTIVLVLTLGQVIWTTGRFMGRLWAADPSRNRSLSWIAIVSNVAFLGIWGVALGLGMTACQLYPYASPGIVHALLGAYGIVAAVLGIVWTPFGVAVVMISARSGLLPRWLSALTAIATLLNFAAIGGLFEMTGPLNPYSGQVAVGLPFYGLVTWYIMVSAWMIAGRARGPGSRGSAGEAGRPMSAAGFRASAGT